VKKTKVTALLMALSCMFVGTSCGDTSAIDNGLNKVIETKDTVKDATKDAIDAAKDATNQIGEIAGWNGEYDTTTDAIAAYADKFKNDFRNKLEEIDPDYVTMLDGYIADLKQAEDNLDKAVQETKFVDTASYAYFKDFDKNKYDITYTLCNQTSDNEKQYLRSRVVTDRNSGNLNVYCSSCRFNTGDTEALSLLGLVYKSCQNNTWYSCNQVEKSKVLTTQAIGYTNIEMILSKCNESDFKSSTLNNLIANYDLQVDSFVTSNTNTMFVYKAGKWIGVIYTTSDMTSYVIVNDVKSGSDISTKLLNAGVDYTLQTSE